MFFRKDCSYKRMLEKCREVYNEEEQKNAEFYIADSRGIPIWNSDTITIDVENGTEELEWNLSRYIHLSNVKYPSKARYYCVRKGLCYYLLRILNYYCRNNITSNCVSSATEIPTEENAVDEMELTHGN